MSIQNATAGLVPTGARRHEDPEAFDEDLEWLLVAGDAAMGAKGTLGGVIAQLEHGGPFTGVPNTDIYTDQQVGLGHTSVGLVERHRWLSGAWQALTPIAAGVLTLCYRAPRAEHRGDELTGSRSGAEAQLGRFAALAFHLTDEPGALLDACRQPQKGKNGRVIARELRKARDAAVEAHKAWSAAKGGAQKPRKRSERRAVLREHVPHLPEADVE
ncbi:MAG TPA: hypothetical protein VGK73_15105 [Polyangiaceae bacterium]